jgi:hypothetical protein
VVEATKHLLGQDGEREAFKGFEVRPLLYQWVVAYRRNAHCLLTVTMTHLSDDSRHVTNFNVSIADKTCIQ